MLPDVPILTADSGDEQFNRGKSINIAVDTAIVLHHATQVVAADTDTFVQPQQMRTALELLDGHAWVAPFSVYCNLTPATTDEVLQGPVDIDWPRRATYEHQIEPVPTGVVMVNVDRFVGFNEDFVGWGYEDNEFAARMRAAHGQVKLVTGACFHLWHPVDQSKTWEQPHIEHNRTLADQALHNSSPFTYNPRYMREVGWE